MSLSRSVKTHYEHKNYQQQQGVHTCIHHKPRAHLSDESFAVLNSEECLMHSIRGHLEITDLAGDHVGIELWLLLGICLCLKYRNVRITHQKRDSTVEWTKLLHLVGAPSSGWYLVLEGRVREVMTMCYMMNP